MSTVVINNPASQSATLELFNKLLMPFSFLNGTKVTTVYETIYSLPISLIKENIVLVAISCYLLWYIKAYLSVSFKSYFF